MKELIEAVKILAEEELQRGYEIHGPHTSKHQAEGVLREEVEEARKELITIQKGLKDVWENVKHDKDSLSLLKDMLTSAVCLSAEAIQVVAMIQKFINYEEGNNIERRG